MTPLEQAVEVFKEGAAKMAPMLGPDDDWEPFIAYQCEDRQRFIIPAPEIGSDQRYAFIAAVEEVLLKDNAVAVAMIHVIWMLYDVSVENARRINRGELPRPSESVDRVEALSILGLDREGNQVQWTAEIVRSDGPPTLKEWKTAPDPILTGAMVEPLRRGIRAPAVEVPEL